MRRLAALAAASSLLGLVALGSPATAAPEDGATISHVQAADGRVDLLVTVPEGAAVDLGAVSLSIGGHAADATATVAGAGGETAVRRTAVLAIDTSLSMKGARFVAARAAAATYLAAVPADVEVGIVTFDSVVRTALAPTTDRAAATGVISGLELADGTLLYDGVLAAVGQLTGEGQRSVLLLSDGTDEGTTPVSTVADEVGKSGVQLDAVALDQGADMAALQTLVTAGHGTLVPSDPAALEQAFAAEAATLARQVLVSAEVPTAISATEAEVAVTLPRTDGTSLTATTYAEVGVAKPAASPAVAVRDAASSLQLPRTALYGGLAAIGLGLLVVLVSLLSNTGGDRRLRNVEERIAAYGAAAVTRSAAGARRADPASGLSQAKDAAASMLQHNKGLEARIEQRLEAGGSSLKSAEWLLLHGTIAILGGMLGLLLGGGSIVLLLVGLAAGSVLPWLWLGHQRKRRVAAFNSGLADTLQLIAGSLSAGMSFAQSIDAVVNEGNEPIAGEFKRVLIETRLGVPLEAALEGIVQRIESVDFAWVVMAIRIQREVGGNLAELLTTVAGTLRERDYLRRQVKTLSAEGRLSAYILIALPIGMFGFMFASRREYIEPLYTTGVGFVMLTAFLVLMALGWATMSRMVKVEV